MEDGIKRKFTLDILCGQTGSSQAKMSPLQIQTTL